MKLHHHPTKIKVATISQEISYDEVNEPKLCKQGKLTVGKKKYQQKKIPKLGPAEIEPSLVIETDFSQEWSLPKSDLESRQHTIQIKNASQLFAKRKTAAGVSGSRTN
ncbi:hypothetical protein PAAG_05715 [Paracoccidioides lutzii Pb01]|uniref:Uncharacterized protein n=1 Tax=Paracoccidioides lutzii (strain ATCC MYA-826 / Pb01) TaxID=502779 RepID=C1H4M2_PARBA|nr:hypothetical protein PAAG_05715 [Paracoccidioides lutzii Pb01]EEH34666.2 hypothetical protein PAAG_05715 [Paracoccidioides lutzii Pb01]